MENDTFNIVLLIVVTLVFSLLAYVIGYVNGMVDVRRQIAEDEKLKELCANELFFYSDSNYKKCEALGITPAP